MKNPCFWPAIAIAIAIVTVIFNLIKDPVFWSAIASAATVVLAFSAVVISRTALRRNRSDLIFTNSLNNLVSDSPIKIEVAVSELLRLSKENAEFNRNIKLAFIKRLKDCPLQQRNMETRLTYAQWILEWLATNHTETEIKEMDLKGCDFTNQDFMTEELKKECCKKLLFYLFDSEHSCISSCIFQNVEVKQQICNFLGPTFNPRYGIKCVE